MPEYGHRLEAKGDRNIRPRLSTQFSIWEQLLQAATEGGVETQVLFQIADVRRPLVSVGPICDMGNRVVANVF